MFESLLPDCLINLKSYEPGRSISEVAQEFGLERVIKLASNENPWGPSPLAVAAVRQAVEGCSRYPDSTAIALRRALAANYLVHTDNIIIGNGSEGIMAGITRAFLQPGDEVVTSEGAFSGFTVLCRTRGVEPIQVPMQEFRFDLNGILERMTPHTKLVYLCNPNNPTGTFFGRVEFDRFVEHLPDRVLVILDEAYFEYAQHIPQFPDSMDYRHDHVITLRTFSKAYGLAGFRVGYGFGHPLLIKYLWKVKLPFEPSLLAQTAALAALQDEDHLRHTLDQNLEGLSFYYAELARLGLRYVPSSTNFIAFYPPAGWTGPGLYQAMLQKGVILRPLERSGMPNWLRVTVGTPQENQMCVSALSQLLQTD